MSSESNRSGHSVGHDIICLEIEVPDYLVDWLDKMAESHGDRAEKMVTSILRTIYVDDMRAELGNIFNENGDTLH